MSTFDDRENAFENKYAHDQEMQFRAEARRNKLLGLWAAELMGKTGEDADAYAREVVKADFEEAGHEDVVRKVAGDLGSLASADEIRSKLEQLIGVAKAQLMEEKG
ncbi:MAG: aldolase [Pseudooceanicola sp.]|nr:aldolase [Pseudooceanicola sp.]